MRSTEPKPIGTNRTSMRIRELQREADRSRPGRSQNMFWRSGYGGTSYQANPIKAGQSGESTRAYWA